MYRYMLFFILRNFAVFLILTKIIELILASFAEIPYNKKAEIDVTETKGNIYDLYIP